MKLFSYPQNPRVWKARIAGKFVGVELPAETSIDFGKDNRSESFLAINPFGQVPTVGDGGSGVFESNSIARYIARLGDEKKSKVSLVGKGALEASRVDAFLYVVLGFESAIFPLVYKSQNQPWTAGYTKSYIDKCTEDAEKIAAGFEQALKNSKFFVGNGPTLADVCWFATSHRAYQGYWTQEFVESKFPLSYAHFRKLEKLPEFSSVVGASISFAAKPASFTFAAPAAPPRFHRLATITDGKTNMKLKLYAETESADIQGAIRSRFNLSEGTKLVLVDEDGCDVVIDGTLETGKYKLQHD